MQFQSVSMPPVIMPVDPWSIVEIVASYGVAALSIMILLRLPSVAQVILERLSGRRWQ